MAKMSNRGMTKKFLITEMDRSIKRMMKLIEEEGDTFAKKAEIYIQKRPKLVAQVEDFYRMFRSLAERYENTTCELRRSLPPLEIRQGSGFTEACSEPPSAITSPERRLTRRLSETQTTFFDFVANKGYETSSVFDSGSDTDDSAFTFSSSSNYGNYRRLRKKINDLEAELKRVKIEQEVNRSSSELVAHYEEELRIANEKIKVSEEEICNLKTKLEEYESVASRIDEFSDESGIDNTEMEDEIEQLKIERDDFVVKMSELEEEISLKDDQIDEMNDRLHKLHLECEKSSKSIEELRCRGRELEKVIEKQREVIEDGVEEKQQAVRQLGISLEHYRNAYQMLRQNLLEHKKPLMAS